MCVCMRLLFGDVLARRDFSCLLQDVKYIQTDGYRAPEAELQNRLAQAGLEAEGDSGCTAAVDLWSLGVVLLEMFSGVKLKETVRSKGWKVGRGGAVWRPGPGLRP